MSGDTGHLQRLTDEQVNARLAAYADGGRFETALRGLWDQVGEVIAEASRRHFGDDACLGRDHFIKPINEAWVRSVADHGLKMYAGKRNVPEFIAARARMTSDVVRVLDERLFGRGADRSDRHAQPRDDLQPGHRARPDRLARSQ